MTATKLIAAAFFNAAGDGEMSTVFAPCILQRRAPAVVASAIVSAMLAGPPPRGDITLDIFDRHSALARGALAAAALGRAERRGCALWATHFARLRDEYLDSQGSCDSCCRRLSNIRAWRRDRRDKKHRRNHHLIWRQCCYKPMF